VEVVGRLCGENHNILLFFSFGFLTSFFVMTNFVVKNIESFISLGGEVKPTFLKEVMKDVMDCRTWEICRWS
jgi:hypothetical protein